MSSRSIAIRESQAGVVIATIIGTSSSFSVQMFRYGLLWYEIRP
jgi:hypothetical protein